MVWIIFQPRASVWILGLDSLFAVMQVTGECVPCRRRCARISSSGNENLLTFTSAARLRTMSFNWEWTGLPVRTLYLFFFCSTCLVRFESVCCRSSNDFSSHLFFPSFPSATLNTQHGTFPSPPNWFKCPLLSCHSRQCFHGVWHRVRPPRGAAKGRGRGPNLWSMTSFSRTSLSPSTAVATHTHACTRVDTSLTLHLHLRHAHVRRAE